MHLYFFCIVFLEYDSKNIKREISQVKITIENEKSDIETLRAELSLLSQPDRIQNLSNQFGLELEPVNVTQIRRIEDIPLKPANRVMDELIQRSLIGYASD
ncbi:MAG: hypothetical protein CML88_01950 [Rhodobiaceae bacterium]|nr:hypothetical protein [Rhodobiaceae bacterium]